MASKPNGWHDGVLYCYGGCGTRYQDFPCDMIVPTAIWNRIAVGSPFDETQVGIEREGRGGVLCPTCIVQRLIALPGVSCVFADIDRPAARLGQRGGQTRAARLGGEDRHAIASMGGRARWSKAAHRGGAHGTEA